MSAKRNEEAPAAPERLVEETAGSILARLAREGVEVGDGSSWHPSRPRDDEDLGALWAMERDASVLVELLRRVDHAAFIRALVACGYATISLLPDDEPRPRDLLAAAEAWLRGEVTEAQVRRATRVAFEAAKETPRRAKGLAPYGPGGIAAVRAIANVGIAIYEAPIQEVIPLAARAFACEREGDTPDAAVHEREFTAALAHLADVVRNAVSRPTYEELLSIH
jgi:hypothetical protein